jgi:hypothetical protein
MSHSILSRDKLCSELRDYLTKRRPHERGETRCLIGGPRALLADGISLFIVRITERDTMRMKPHRQRQGRWDAGKVYLRRTYSHSAQNYTVAAISWQTGQVVELQAFSTKAAALRAMLAHTR